MLIPKELYEVVVILPQKYVDALLEKLGKEEIIEIKEFNEEYRQIPSIDTPLMRTNQEVKALMRIDYMIERLKVTKAKPGNISKEPINEAESIVDKIDTDYNKYIRAIEDNNILIERLNLLHEFLSSVKSIKIRENQTSFLITTDDDSWKEISKNLKDDGIGFFPIKKRISGEKTARFISVKNDDSEKVVGLFAGIADNVFSGNIKNIDKKLKEKINEIKKDIKDNQDRLENLPEEYGSLLFSLREQLNEKLKIIENKRNFLYSEFLSLINLWVAKSDYNMLKKIVSDSTNNNFVLYKENPKITDNPPTRLSNFFLFRPFEMLLEEFSLPGYKEIDPTFFIALFFPLFFGIMLSDVGYGLLLLIISSFILIKNKGKSRFGKIIFMCSLTTIAIGLYFGSWFGFNLTKVHLNPLHKPIELMLIALAIGVFYVNLSLILALVQSVIKKDWKFLLDEVLVWLFFEIGILFLVYPKLYEPYTTLPLNLLFSIGPVIYRLMRKGLLNILDFSKFFSTIISFIRISALAMSTVWISFAVNLIFNMLRQFPKGIIPAVVVLVLGHSFNFAFNTFGSFLQAMRLHYVEFLGQFYKGKGRKMNLFSIKKEYALNDAR
ncbi:MAG: hypothetical protein KKF44_10245 [Nanoarchaeota archaeon]|nr:hypothetical protein [Nanoarchaeota archaeon]